MSKDTTYIRVTMSKELKKKIQHLAVDAEMPDNKFTLKLIKLGLENLKKE